MSNSLAEEGYSPFPHLPGGFLEDPTCKTLTQTWVCPVPTVYSFASLGFLEQTEAITTAWSVLSLESRCITPASFKSLCRRHLFNEAFPVQTIANCNPTQRHFLLLFSASFVPTTLNTFEYIINIIYLLGVSYVSPVRMKANLKVVLFVFFGAIHISST